MPARSPVDAAVSPFVPHGRFTIRPPHDGPLSGLSFAAKDLFDVAGHPTGAGNPAWLESHALPTAHSPVIARLLDHGAELRGKTLTDELAYSIHGDNIHYGMPLNAAAPDRVCGGSSSGSVAAVAAREVDFALGTDTGGSTRVPASYCGVWGLRTSHDLISRQGLVPLHPGFDTVTWFAHAAATFLRVGESLLPTSDFRAQRLVCLDDAMRLADSGFQPVMERLTATLADLLGSAAAHVDVAPAGLDVWRQAYVTAGAYEGWQVHGDWISTHTPRFAPAIAARWNAAAAVSAGQAKAAQRQCGEVRAHVRQLIANDAVAILPSAASVAPLRSAGGAELEEVRARTMRITCIAGLAGLPQVSIPLRDAARLPIGISLLGPAGSDLELIRLAIRLRATFGDDCGKLC